MNVDDVVIVKHQWSSAPDTQENRKLRERPKDWPEGHLWFAPMLLIEGFCVVRGDGREAWGKTPMEAEAKAKALPAPPLVKEGEEP